MTQCTRLNPEIYIPLCIKSLIVQERKYVLILSFLKINYRTQKQEIEKNKSTKRVSNSFQYTHCVRTEIFATIFYSLMQSLSLLEF